MALIKCQECGKEFSDRANACPNCACPNEKINNIKKNTKDNENEKTIMTLETDIDFINRVKKIELILLSIVVITFVISISVIQARRILIMLAIPTLIIGIFYLILAIAKNNRIELTNKRIKGKIIIWWNEETVNIPLDKIDNIYIARGFTTLPTLCISSTLRIKKMKFAKDPEKFCNKALEMIEKYKTNIYQR